jgi:hypothetical protein
MKRVPDQPNSIPASSFYSAAVSGADFTPYEDLIRATTLHPADRAMSIQVRWQET